jgi:hypothetical protein
VGDGTSALEIRTYRLASGGRQEFLRIMAEEAVPMLRRYGGVEVVAFGAAAQDDDRLRVTARGTRR